jgi:hypothetical protein
MSCVPLGHISKKQALKKNLPHTVNKVLADSNPGRVLTSFEKESRN